jgi:hypothetical protein
VTTPLLYAPLQDLRLLLASTDGGIGTAAQLNDQQLTLALEKATNEISVFAGNVWDSSTAQAVPPVFFHDLCLTLAGYYATQMYMKNKAIPADHPMQVAYNRATKILDDVRDGVVRLDPVPVGGIGDEIGVIINRIPPVFTGDDSNTRIDPMTGALESDVPIGMWAPRGDSGWLTGPIYQG